MTKAAAELHCLIVTPEKQVVDKTAHFVVLTAHDGQIGIMPEHSALLTKLAPGIVRIDSGPKTDYFFVAGGFAEVVDNRITVLTPQALTTDQLNDVQIQDELIAAEKMSMKTQVDRQKRQLALDIARGKRTTLAEFRKTQKR